MKIVISPAKSLDFETAVPTLQYTQGIFLSETEKISSVLKKQTPQKLAELMHISSNLGELNWQRNQNWQLPFTLENAKQAIFAFSGDVYTGLDAYSLSEEKILQLQQKLRILSGQYGLLKPLDLIQPYRLEMGTKLKIGTKDNLYQFWDSKVTQAINNELSDKEVLVNLASNEYFKVIKPKLLKAEIITPVFKDYKDGKLKVISFFAKKARGLMVRYIVDNNIENVTDLKGFDSDCYAFDSNLSSNNELVFTR
ncbi:peroxide stress protein YaaA [Lutibacter sp. HS1-25]|uniref:peroxide stress protein YaaA n=1 Tax=Lutibacter sp. HS1-25 TaxID=2485000 RepID=UPI001012E9AD|nr:peroxide stress protein YaaA [Lutibacter sp. HS1-25]RXP58615.1 peroxide stress protein YaaA [Lutibacter sp. HS1-25]